jgi:hypothetical protein
MNTSLNYQQIQAYEAVKKGFNNSAKPKYCQGSSGFCWEKKVQFSSEHIQK